MRGIQTTWQCLRNEASHFTWLAGIKVRRKYVHAKRVDSPSRLLVGN